MSFLVPVDKFKTRSTAADDNNFKLKKKEDFLIKWSAGLERDKKNYWLIILLIQVGSSQSEWSVLERINDTMINFLRSRPD